MSSSRWYISQNLKPLGPFTLQEMRLKVHKGEVGPTDLVLNEEQGDWVAASQWGCFEAALYPSKQGHIDGIAPSQEKEWIVLMPHPETKSLQQEGPFSVQEVLSSLKAGRVQPSQYVWKSGLSGWCRLQDRPEFSV